jgi:hypothetical protein
VTVRWIPLLPAAYGTRVARPARRPCSHLASTARAWPLGEARPRRPLHRWQRPKGSRQRDGETRPLVCLLSRSLVVAALRADRLRASCGPFISCWRAVPCGRGHPGIWFPRPRIGFGRRGRAGERVDGLAYLLMREHSDVATSGRRWKMARCAGVEAAEEPRPGGLTGEEGRRLFDEYAPDACLG